MDAKITMTMTAQEFDLLRNALVEARDNAGIKMNDSNVGASTRQVCRQRVAELSDLLTKLK